MSPSDIKTTSVRLLGQLTSLLRQELNRRSLREAERREDWEKAVFTLFHSSATHLRDEVGKLNAGEDLRETFEDLFAGRRK